MICWIAGHKWGIYLWLRSRWRRKTAWLRLTAGGQNVARSGRLEEGSIILAVMRWPTKGCFLGGISRMACSMEGTLAYLG